MVAIIVAILGMGVIEIRNASRVATLENRITAMEDQRLSNIEGRLSGMESVAGGIRTMVLSRITSYYVCYTKLLRSRLE